MKLGLGNSMVRSAAPGFTSLSQLASLVSEWDCREAVGTNPVTNIPDLKGSNDLDQRIGNPSRIFGTTPNLSTIPVSISLGDAMYRFTPALPSGSSDRTLFLCALFNGAAVKDAGFAYGNGVNDQACGLVKRTDNYGGFQVWGGNDVSMLTVMDNSTYYVLSATVESSVITVYVNNFFKDTSAFGLNTILNKLVLGSEIGVTTDGVPMAFAGASVFDEALSASQLTDVYNYYYNNFLKPPGGAPSPSENTIEFNSDEVNFWATPITYGD